ncbi:MAG: hypothetical protein AAF716_05555 [Cyanobacteria bacterium P01_D01_bin.1]
MFTNDDEKAAEKMTIHYHCLNCNSQFFEHPQQKEVRDREEKKADRSNNDPSLSWGIMMVAMLASTILLINLIRQSEERQDSFQSVSQLSLRA